MKTVVDLFVAKDRTAVFWFTMACASILLSAIYVNRMVADVSTKPVYVVMDPNGTYYFAPSVEIHEAAPMQEALTRLAMETIYTRDQARLVYDSRVKTLFFGNSIKGVYDELAKDAKKATEEERKQEIEVTSVTIFEKLTGSGAKVEAKGIISRTANVLGRPTKLRFNVTARFAWQINSRMGKNPLPPMACTEMKLGNPEPIKDDA
jgi:hypothetical protein